MVNSGSFDSDGQGDRNAKVSLTQLHIGSDSTQSSSPVTASVAAPCNSGFSQTADGGLPSVAAIEPTPTKTEFNCDMPVVENITSVEEKTGPSLCCSLPLEKVQGVLTPYTSKPQDEGAKATTTPKQPTRKLLCLYCDRSFVSSNLRQKHVERVHSVKQNRRVSSRRQNQLTVTPCVYCDRLNGTENTLKDLFQHLVNEHSGKYFGCLPCEDRFLTSSLLADHNAVNHQNTDASAKTTLKLPHVEDVVKAGFEEQAEEIPVKITRSRTKPKPEQDDKGKKSVTVNKKKSTKLKELRSKKLSVKSSRIALKRRESKRLQATAKITDTQKKKRSKHLEKKNSNTGKTDPTNSTKSTDKLKTCINPYPEFDHFYRVKKITDHSIDNLKISSLTFDDVFDKAFFNRIRCNIEDNLLHHIDGKLFKNEESENRISNFEKVSNAPQEIQNSSSESYGCELSLNAVTPVASLSINSQFGEDFESQIEYGSKPSKKKTQPRKDEIHYKYFTRRKYQASILEHKENRDLSKLDMWTQLVIKKRQQKMLDDKKSAKEMLEYTSGDEYKNKLRREELNRILDRRGPFEDLKEEASKKAALDKLNSSSEDNISEETFTEVREVLNEILNRVFAATEQVSVQLEVLTDVEKYPRDKKEDAREIPGYLNLRRSSSLPSDGEIDKSDRISLICSSQETENFELPTNQVRGKNELIELTGEWARCRMYICAACGAKLPNMKYLLDHKSLYHQNVWVQHYEFVGNQSELYRHLSIPALGKVGAVEDTVQCKVWKRSDARLCTKCGKQCNALGELHRHILECGGDWTWMLARKKCKYRPFGAKSRRKRRGLINRVHHKQKTEPTEKKKYKKSFEGPRQRPSDADTIQRMLANLPAKRSTRKLISLYDGIYRARKTTTIKQNKVKCGKVIYKSSTRNETTEKAVNAEPSVITSSSSRRSLRNLNKVLASRILDTNTKLNVKRKIKALNERRKTRQTIVEQEANKEVVNDENIEQAPKIESREIEEIEAPVSKTSPRSSPKNIKKKMSVKKLLTGKISIKSFFPVKKKKIRKILSENQNPQDTENVETTDESNDMKTRSKRKSKESSDIEPQQEVEGSEAVKTVEKKSKSETFSSLVRSLSMRKKKLAGKAVKVTSLSVDIDENQLAVTEQSEEKNDDAINKKADKSGKKRKLKSSFRSVINRVKKLKIDNAPSVETADVNVDPKNSKDGAFLEEEPSVPVQVEKALAPSVSESKKDTPASVSIAIKNPPIPNENPPIPETIFKLDLSNEKSLQAKGELDFDTQPVKVETTNTGIIIKESEKTQPISIETAVKQKTVPLVSPNMKGRIRKPARGLNDCIAMLTSKLQQKTLMEENAVKADECDFVPRPGTFPDSYVSKTECILRIPTYRTQITYSEVEETALDLSTKSKDKEQQEPVKKYPHIFDRKNLFDDGYNNKKLTAPTISRAFNSVDRIIEEVVGNQKQSVVLEAPQRKWNSVDDIIQKVVDDQVISSLKLPVRNSVDSIIDFVVQYGENKFVSDKINEIAANFIPRNKEICCRKLGSTRKPKVKKAPVQVTNPEPKFDGLPPVEPPVVVATLPKKSFEPVCPTISLDINAKLQHLYGLDLEKAENNATKVWNDIQSLDTRTLVAPSVPTTTEVVAPVPTCNGAIEDASVVSTSDSSTEQILPLLNDAFIQTPRLKVTKKAGKKARKVGHVRNRSPAKKIAGNKIAAQETMFIETNVDALLGVTEVGLNPGTECSTNLPVSSESFLTKSEEVKQLCNEDEPHLLENKPVTVQQKLGVTNSDSEDEVPLAALAKSKAVDGNEGLLAVEKLSEEIQSNEFCVDKLDACVEVNRAKEVAEAVVPKKFAKKTKTVPGSKSATKDKSKNASNQIEILTKPCEMPELVPTVEQLEDFAEMNIQDSQTGTTKQDMDNVLISESIGQEPAQQLSGGKDEDMSCDFKLPVVTKKGARKSKVRKLKNKVAVQENTVTEAGIKNNDIKSDDQDELSSELDSFEFETNSQEANKTIDSKEAGTDTVESIASSTNYLVKELQNYSATEAQLEVHIPKIVSTNVYLSANNSEQVVPSKPVLIKSGKSSKKKCKATKSKPKKLRNTKTIDSFTHLIDSKPELNSLEERNMEVVPENKADTKLPSQSEEKSVLKVSIRDVCNEVQLSNGVLNESDDTDKEIESIFFAVRPEGVSKPKSGSLNEKTCTENIPEKHTVSNGKSVDNINNSLGFVPAVEEGLNSASNKIIDGKREVNGVLSKTPNSNGRILKGSQLAVVLDKAPKETTQPLLKNLEITLALTYIPKSYLSSTNSDAFVLAKEKNNSSKDTKSLDEPLIMKNKKKQSRSVRKKSLNCTDMGDGEGFNCNLAVTKSSNRYRYKSDKSKHVESFQVDTVNNTAALGPELIRVDRENKIVASLNEAEVIPKVEPECQLNKTESQIMIKPKVRSNRRSRKASKKPKSKRRKTLAKSKLQYAEMHKSSEDLLSAKSQSVDANVCVTEKDNLRNHIQTKENIPEITGEELPIKIVINKQKTRRKSKSFKKIDLKGQNDLFEDFALVIKKPKRIAPLITFTPADAFSKNVYESYSKKSVEPVFNDVPEPEEETFIEPPLELDSSVEEMDMELDEIPITSNIIERDTKSFLPPMDSIFAKAPVEGFANSLKEMEGDNCKRRDEDLPEVVPVELFLPEKELTLATEAEVERFLYESAGTIDNKSSREIEPVTGSLRSDPSIQISTITGSYEVPQSLAITDLVPETVCNKSGSDIAQVAVVAKSEVGITNTVFAEELEIHRLEAENKNDRKTHGIKKSSYKKARKGKKGRTSRVCGKGSTGAEFEDVKSGSFELLPVLHKIECNLDREKEKQSMSVTLPEIASTRHIDSISSLLNNSATSDKLKDIDSIYAFSESEDLEIEKPIEKPKRPSRKQTKSMSEIVEVPIENSTAPSLESSFLAVAEDVEHVQEVQDVDANYKEISDKSNIINNRPNRPSSTSTERKINGEIRENDLESQEEKRKSVRSAKTKALEHIHDDALAELTDNERNKSFEKAKRSSNGENITPVEEFNKKKVNRRKSVSQNPLEEAKLTGDDTFLDAVDDNDKLIQEVVPTLDELADEPVIKQSDKEVVVSNLHEFQPVVNKGAEVVNDQIRSTKKKNCNSSKTEKSKKLTDPFQLMLEDAEKSLLLKDIAIDLSGLEELENSIEKELNADLEVADCYKQLNSKAKQTSFSDIKLNDALVEPASKKNDQTIEDNQELRRSKRGSRKVKSYNENDLIDPLLDEISDKRKIRKKEKAVLEELESKNLQIVKEPEKKLNSDELFDLLKASSKDKQCVKSQNEFLNNVNGTSSDLNDDNFQNAFENILQQSSSLINQSNSVTAKEQKNIDSIYEFTDSPEQAKDLVFDTPTKQNKNTAKTQQSKLPIEDVSNSASISCSVSETRSLVPPPTPDILEVSKESKTVTTKRKPDSREKISYCEICDRKFMRTDNLAKHKRTLTHIQKLSEIEAKEAAQKSQAEQPSSDSSKTTNSVIEITSDSSKITQNGNINIQDILQDSNKPVSQEGATEHTSFQNNHSLKLADIINDVLNKPVLDGEDQHNNFSDIIMQNKAEVQPEYRRYKSLGERKSFDSEPAPVPEPYVSKTTILEKQISLLENIIENQTGVNYIDDISMSSNNSLENNVSPSELSLKQDDSNTYTRINLETKPNDSFLKPSQYEEISEDSANVRSYEDQKLRKALNRDEELFLECCSLLKSGSEMSTYSNKRTHNKVLNTMGLKQCDEPEWLERKCLVEKPLYDVGNEYSDNSRIPTPLGDSYDDDASNSNTITSHWNINRKIDAFEDVSQDKDANKSFSFQEILNEEVDKETDGNKSRISKFGAMLSKTFCALPKIIKRSVPDALPEKKRADLSGGYLCESKKIITKGARKVFEGLKVSIPTEELNLEEVLNCSPQSKKIDIAHAVENHKISSTKPSRTARKSKPVKNKAQFGSNLLFKMKKKKITSPTSPNKSGDEAKAHDIYDFEETQDNTDVFTKPDFRAFRNMKCNETAPEPGSDTDSRDCMDSFSFEASSISSSSSKKPKAQENITKKKYMIMGRIFKNAAKSKMEDIDEEIRDIPALDNCELVQNYVADCKNVIRTEEVAKPKLSEKEIDQLFDKLLEDRLGGQDAKTALKPKPEIKKTDTKKKAKPKNKKRTRTNSDSTDDEFSLKASKKRAYRKNAKAEDNCINLEQELKECIGVASRKSQRKCTSGKQNILVEYWSSDDSQFEALLESQRIEVKQPSPSKVAVECNNSEECEPVVQVPETHTATSPATAPIIKLPEAYKPKTVDKKPQPKRKPSSEKKPSKSVAPTVQKSTADTVISNRRKRAAVNPLYHWSSSSEDESQDLIEVKPIRDELEDEDDRPVQHGWIVGDSPKKLVTMLAQAKGKKTDIDCVKEQGKKRTTAVS